MQLNYDYMFLSTLKPILVILRIVQRGSLHDWIIRMASDRVEDRSFVSFFVTTPRTYESILKLRVVATILSTWDCVAYDDRLLCFMCEMHLLSNIKNMATTKKQSPRCSRILNRRNPAQHRVVLSTLMTLRQEEKKGNPLM
jgi:hypothetical protein